MLGFVHEKSSTTEKIKIFIELLFPRTAETGLTDTEGFEYPDNQKFFLIGAKKAIVLEQLRVRPIDTRYISELSTKIRISQNAARKRSVEPSDRLNLLVAKGPGKCFRIVWISSISFIAFPTLTLSFRYILWYAEGKFGA
jgi:hypothetical protein